MCSLSLINLPVLKSKAEGHRNFQGPGTSPRDAWLPIGKAEVERLVQALSWRLDKGPSAGCCALPPTSLQRVKSSPPDAESAAIVRSLQELPWLKSSSSSKGPLSGLAPTPHVGRRRSRATWGGQRPSLTAHHSSAPPLARWLPLFPPTWDRSFPGRNPPQALGSGESSLSVSARLGDG